MKVLARFSAAVFLVANSSWAFAAPTGINTPNYAVGTHLGHTVPIGIQDPTFDRRDLLSGLLGALPGASLLGSLLPGAAPTSPAQPGAQIPATPAAGGDGLLGGILGLVTSGPLAGITDSLKNTLVDTFL